MLDTIVITDLTTMGGDRICVAGIGSNGQCIRPVLPKPNSVLIQNLYAGPTLVIRPRAKIRFNFSKVALTPPHIEDPGFDPSSVTYQGLCNDTEWESVLRESSFSSVKAIYDGLLQEPHWVTPGVKTRSLGTLSKAKVTNVTLAEWSGQQRYRLSFSDRTGTQYTNVIIADLAFRAFADAQAQKLNSLASASNDIRNLLAKANRLYLRLGLARPWANPNNKGRQECWMQVTGIHAFPDYLGGRTFADFAPQQRQE